MPGDGSIQTAEGSSRKRLKISRDTGRPAGMPNPSEPISLISPAKPAATESVQNDLHNNGTPCHHEQSLRNMGENLDAMRQLITCKICQRFLYEPYALTCGHTFCYSCLSQWLNQDHKKSCPDCRTVIKEQPSPSYLVREMVLVFVSKSELLPDGETSEEHNQSAKEEADIVAADKANTDVRTGGLFKGCFRKGGARVPLMAIRDNSDNVDRCPQCLNEVEDGRCNTCNVRVRGPDDGSDWSDSDDDLDLDYDLDAEDDDDHPAAYWDDPMFHGVGGLNWSDGDDDMDDLGYGDEMPPGAYAFGGFERGGRVSDVSDSDSDDDDDEHDPDMEGFIDDATPHIRRVNESSEVDEESDGTEVDHSRSRRWRRANPIVLSDEESDDEPPPIPPPRRRRIVVAPRPSEMPSSAGANRPVESDDEEDDSDEDPVPASQRARNRPMGRRQVSVVSDEEPSEDETDATRSMYGGFSPQDLTGESDDHVHHDDDEENEHEDYDRSDAQSSMSGPTEQSMDHYDDEHDDDERSLSDASDDNEDGWVTQNSARGLGSDSLTHRLHTLEPRRNRHADPPSDSPPSYSSLFPDGSATRRVLQQTQQPRTYRPANAAFRPVQPAHPFNLDNTLASIRDRRQQEQSRVGNRRNASNVSSQDSVGGVSVASSASGSSGSSRTIRADEISNPSRRRRFAEMDADDSDY